MDPIDIVILIGVILSFLISAVSNHYAHLREKKRTRELSQVAADLGFDFFPEGNPAFAESLSDFHLFSHGHSKRLWNLLYAKSRNLTMACFDYKYTAHRPIPLKGFHTYTRYQSVKYQSVLYFRFEGTELPCFFLQPQNIWDKIGSYFGYQDINFDDYPVFSDYYLLRGTDEKLIRRLFTNEVIQFYENQPDLNTEIAGNTLLYYHHSFTVDQRVNPPLIHSFMENGFRVLSLFTRSYQKAYQK